jgi:hypothetical protein
MLVIATGIKGKKGDDYYFNDSSNEDEDEGKEKKELAAVYQTVRNYWNNFCSGCRKMGYSVSFEHKEEMTKVRFSFMLPYQGDAYGCIKYNKTVLHKIAKLRDVVRERKFASPFHFDLLVELLFRRDWMVYSKPRTRIIDWAIRSANFYGSARIGEYILSSAKEDLKGRGVCLKVK